MAKKKISKKQKKSATKFLKEHEPFSSDELKDAENVVEVLLESIKTGDLDSFRAVLAAHLTTVNKLEFAKRAGIGRRTLYDLVDPDKEFNPELSTISAVISALAV